MILQYNLDKYRKYSSPISQKVKQGDTLTLKCNIFEKGQAKNLAGYTADLRWVNANNTFVNIAGSKVAIVGNIVTIQCDNNCTKSAGICKFELHLHSNTEEDYGFTQEVKVLTSVIQGQDIANNISTIIDDLNEANINAEKFVRDYGNLYGIKTELDIANARIDNFTHLAEGSTTGDAELIDGRIGAYGEQYDNIGTAIREQLSRVNKSLFTKLSATWESGGMVSSTGVPTENIHRARSNYIKVNKNTTIESISKDIVFVVTEFVNTKYDVITYTSEYINKYTVQNDCYIRIAGKYSDEAEINNPQSFGDCINILSHNNIEKYKNILLSCTDNLDKIGEISNRNETNLINYGLENLINNDNDTVGYYVSYEYGSLQPNTDFSVSEYIKILPKKEYRFKYYCSNNQNISVQQFCFYTKDKTFISGNIGKEKGEIVFTTPEDAHYIRLTMENKYKKYAQLSSSNIDKFFPYRKNNTNRLKVIVSEDGSADFDSLYDALYYTDVSVDVVVRGAINVVNDYKKHYGSNFWENYSGYYNSDDLFLRGYFIAKYRRIYGESNSHLVFNYTGNNSSVGEGFSIIAPTYNNIIENLTIESVSGNCRYLVHEDFATGIGEILYKNCVFIGTTANGAQFGAGLGVGNIYNIENCMFLGNGNGRYDISFHGNSTPSATTAESRVYLKNCYCEGNVGFRWYGTSTKVSEAIVNGCTMKKLECIAYNDQQKNENIKLYQWNNIITG